MTESTALVNIGDLAEPITVLVERICDAIGGYFEPFQIRRVAEAEADAELIRALAEIEITQLQQRAMRRFVAEEAKRQDNMESITRKAIRLVESDSQPSEVEEDWIVNFFDKCRLVSDEEMQDLWAKVLAGEANTPGAYSKRTVNALGSLDKKDATLFKELCGFGVNMRNFYPLVYSHHDEIYAEHGITYGSLLHLDAIGLLSFSALSGLRWRHLPKTRRVYYYGTPIDIEFKDDQDNELPAGMVLLTQTGQELAPICGSQPVPGFLEYVQRRWRARGIVVSSPCDEPGDS